MNFKDYWITQYRRFEKKLSGDELIRARGIIKEMEGKRIKASEIINKLSREFPDLREKWKAERVFETESKRSETKTIRSAAFELDFSKFRVLVQPDACPLCKAITDNGSRTFSKGTLRYKNRIIPPIHPNCHCVLIPIE